VVLGAVLFVFAIAFPRREIITHDDVTAKQLAPAE